MSTVLTEKSRAGVLVTLAALVCLLATACGSNLDPEQVAATQARGGATGTSVTGPGEAVASIEMDGTVTGPDTGEDGPVGTDTAPQTGPDPGGSSGGGDTAPDTPPEEVPSENAPVGDGPQGDCDGFTNQTGVTDSTITIGNAADISGPVPGLFQSARQGTQAFVAYYNRTEKLCGRSLKVLELDSKADAAADQQAYVTGCQDTFAMVGSVSSQDAGGAATAAGCGLPDIRAFTVTPQRQSCGTCFAAYAIDSGQVADALPKYWLQKEPEASQHVGIFYVNVDAARTNAESFASAFEKNGMNVDVVQGIDTAEFNYVPYVTTMKNEDLDFIMYFGPYQFALRLQQAMQQQQYKPRVFLEDPTIYDSTYVAQSNGAGEGAYVYSVIQLFDSPTAEMRLYRQFLEQVAPGAVPNYYGLFAWSATRLFVEQATALGGDLSRESLVASMRKVKGWTGNGLHTAMAVGAGTTAPCVKIIQLTGSSWRQVSPGDFMCGGLTNVG